MGKLSAYLLGMTAALVLSYYVLSLDYSAIIAWIGPVLGSDIIFPLTFLYLLLGSILVNPLLLVSWILIGTVVGVSARKGTRAIGAAVAVYFSIWGFFLVSLLALFEGLSSSGTTTGILSSGTLNSLPPLPPGTTISAILTEPLFQPLLSLISQFTGLTNIAGFQTGGTATTPSFSAAASTVVYTFVPYLIVNIIVFIVTAALIGRLINYALHPGKGKGATPSDSAELSRRGRVRKVRKVVRKVSVTLWLLFVVLLAILVVTPNLNHATTNGAQSAYSMNSGLNDSSRILPNTQEALNALLAPSSLVFNAHANAVNTTYNGTTVNSFSYGAGMIGTYGNIYNIYAFFNTTPASGSSFLTQGAAGQSILSLILLSDNLESIFSALAQDGVISNQTVTQLQDSQLYNLIPQGVILLAFPGNLQESSPLASEAASNLSSYIGSTSLHKFIGLSLPTTLSSGGPGNISLYAYTISLTTYPVENKLVQAGAQYLPSDGMFTSFESGISTGYLVPDYTTASVHGSIFLAGRVNLATLSSNLASFTSLFNSAGVLNQSSSVVFMGGAFVRENVIHSSIQSHNITGAQIFGYDGNIKFNNNNTVYALSVLYPERNLSNPANPVDYISLVYSTISNFTAFGQSSNIYYQLLSYGSVFSLHNFSVVTNATFPADVIISQNVTKESGNLFNVTITLMNNDTDTLTNVSIFSNVILASYGGNAVVTSGSPVGQVVSLYHEQSLSITYSVNLKNVGTYVVAAPLANYTLNGTTFSMHGKISVAQAQPPAVWYAINQVELSSLTVLSNATGFSGLIIPLLPGFYVFDLILIFLVGIDVYIEYRAYVRWVNARKNKGGTPPNP